jgi:hypothetical protein
VHAAGILMLVVTDGCDIGGFFPLASVDALAIVVCDCCT